MFSGGAAIPTFQLYVLGPPKLEQDGQPVTIRRRKVLALLVYLAVSGRTQRRDSLAALFWPEDGQSEARANLSRNLSQIRKIVGDDHLASDRETVSLQTGESFWLDVRQFESRIAECEAGAPGCFEVLEEAAGLYRDDFLAGFTLPDCPEFDDWQLFTAEELRLKLGGALDRLVEMARQKGEPAAGLPYARRRLALDPLHEAAERSLLRLYAEAGRPADALRQYEQWRAAFEGEMGLPPSDETQQLFERVRTGEFAEQASPAPIPVPHPASASPPVSTALLVDRREAPEVHDFFGREAELAQLENWILEENCRLVAVLGIGGQGKTTLAARFTQQLVDAPGKSPFSQVIWRSLLNATPLSDLLPEMLQFLSRQQLAEMPASLDRRLDLLLGYLQAERCLLVLDNFESLLQAGSSAGEYREGYEDYGLLLMRVGQHEHQSSLLLTSREAPQALRRLAKDSARVQLLELAGLSDTAGRELLQQRGLAAVENALIERYSGNPLALKLVADTIDELFFGDVQTFLSEETLIFDDIRAVLAQQVARLSDLEREILTWLAIEREPVTPEALWQDLVPGETRREFLEALRGLQRRSLLEKTGQGFTLQNVVIEFLVEGWVDQVCEAIENGEAGGLNRHALIKAQSSPYIRESQARLILKPVADRLLARLGKSGLQNAMAGMRKALRAEQVPMPGYAGGNMLNLLLHIGSDLAGADFSHLSIWQADLQGKTLNDVNLEGADLSGALLSETFNNVLSVAISPDGDLLAAGSQDGTIMIWSLTDGRPLAAIEAHTIDVKSIRFSPDSRLLASAGGGTGNYMVAIWDARTGQALAKIIVTDHWNIVDSVAFSPDGGTLASGHSDNCVYLWDVAEALRKGTSQPFRVFKGHRLQVLSVDISPDGSLLASGSRDQSVILWDISTGKIAAKLTDHTAGIWKVRFSPDGRMLASAGEDHNILLWDMDEIRRSMSGRPIRTLEGHKDWVRGLSFHPSDPILASAAEDQTVRLWDLDSGQAIQILPGHTRKKVTSVHFHPGGDLLASGSDDQTVRLWDVSVHDDGSRLGRNIKTFKGYTNKIWKISFSPNGKTLASAGADMTVRLWQMGQPLAEAGRLEEGQLEAPAAEQPYLTLVGHTDEVVDVRFSPDGSLLASGSWDYSIRLWDAASGRCLKTLRGHNSDVQKLAFHPDGRVLASFGTDFSIHLWDVHSGAIVQKLMRHQTFISSIVFSPDGKILISAGWDRAVLFWDVGSGLLIGAAEDLGEVCINLCFSPDGTLLAGGFSDGTIRLWKASEPEKIRIDRPYQTIPSPSNGIWSIDFSPDGRYLAVTAWSGDLKVYVIDLSDLNFMENENSRIVLQDHELLGGDASFSPGENILVTCDLVGRIRLWELETWKMLKTLRVDRPYERTDITGVTGLTEGQVDAMKALGAVVRG